MGRVIRTKNDIGAKLKAALAIDNLTTKVGWLDGAKYEDGTPVAYVAAINELGVNQRPFMRPTAIEKKNEWAGIAKTLAKRIISGQMSPEDAMGALGMAAEGDIRKTIAGITAPPLKPGTIKSRQRKLANGKKVGNLSKPLVESSLMITSLTSAVEKK